jgi:hypothetical protein
VCIGMFRISDCQQRNRDGLFDQTEQWVDDVWISLQGMTNQWVFPVDL